MSCVADALDGRVAAMAEMLAIDLTVADAAACDRAVRLAAQVRGCATAVEVAVSRRVAELHAAGSCPRLEVMLGERFGKTEANKIVRRSEQLDQLPAFEPVLQHGEIGPAHVDAVAAAVSQAPVVADHQDELVEAAKRMGPDDFQRHCTHLAFLLADDGGVSVLERQRAASVVKRWVDRATGMYMTRAELDPERGAQLWAAIDSHIEQNFHSGTSSESTNDQRAAVALHAVATSERGGGVGATVHVHVDLETITRGLHERSRIDIDGGGTLPVDTLRRMACDADIIPHVLNRHGVILDQGRAQRLATRPQRQALRAMYRTCAMPGCSVPFAHAKIHHIHPWEAGGPTDLDNMLPVCERHHHDLHEGHWQLTLDPHTRGLTITQPDGKVTTAGLPP